MIRNTAKAMIIRGDKLLFIKKKLDSVGIYFTLPGGGQENNETMEETIVRECKEELGIDVQIKNLLCVREYISKNHEYSFLIRDVHALEFVFICSSASSSNILNLQADVAQLGYEWLNIQKVIESIKGSKGSEQYRFPRTLTDLLKEYFIEETVESYISFKF